MASSAMTPMPPRSRSNCRAGGGLTISKTRHRRQPRMAPGQPTAVIAGEDGRAEAESRRDREHGPHDRPQKRAAEIERAIGARANDADTGRHLAERLSTGRERDQVAAVLDDQEREQRPLREHRE